MENITLGLEAAANGDTEMIAQLVNGTYDYDQQSGGDLATEYNSPEDALRANPSPQMKQFYDQKYGAGAADRVLGG